MNAICAPGGRQPPYQDNRLGLRVSLKLEWEHNSIYRAKARTVDTASGEASTVQTNCPECGKPSDRGRLETIRDLLTYLFTTYLLTYSLKQVPSAVQQVTGPPAAAARVHRPRRRGTVTLVMSVVLLQYLLTAADPVPSTHGTTRPTTTTTTTTPV